MWFRSACLLLPLMACSSTELPGASRPSDAEPGTLLDSGRLPQEAGVADADGALDASETDAEADAGLDSGVEDAAGDADTGTPPVPVDCRAGLDPAWQLCASSPSSCEVKFEDGAGCSAVCAALGLNCATVYEDVSGQCAADLARPTLSCVPQSGHMSDYCVCVSEQCSPDCTGKVCGDDGCGGSCGSCGADEQCNAGACGPVMMDCSSVPYAPAALLAERVGFGRNATGGEPNRVYHVTTTNDGGAGSLRRALESNEPYWVVFDNSATYTFRNPITIRSNKTIDGRGRRVVLEGSLRLSDARNVIITDVAVTNTLEGRCGQDGDVLLLQGDGTNDPAAFTTRDIWINHVEAYDGGDGLIDLRGASGVTIAWSHLHTHKKAMLMWQDRSGRPTPGMQVTLHHNFFDRITLRGPQLIYGQGHMFNNYHYRWYEYGAASLGDAQLHSENNIYEARPESFCVPACPDPNPCGDNDFAVSKSALVTEWSSNGTGNSRSVGDLALEGAVITQNQAASVFQPSSYYNYVAEPASMALAQRVRDEAGPRNEYCQGP